MPSDSTLTLFIPDLLGLQPALSKLAKEELPKLPVFEKWLSRGKWELSAQQEDVIFSEFDILIEENKDKPFSALSLLAENNHDFDVQEKYWLRADPVCIQPDRDTAVLVAHEELALTREEADKLANEINTHFADEPWQLHVLHPLRWYIQIEKTQNLVTHSLGNVIGRDINQFLPVGNDAKYWVQCANEIQMLLHGSNINFERESRGLWTVNSLWLWGGGSLPETKTSNIPYDTILTDDILLSGIGRFCGIDVLSLDETFFKEISQGNTFILLDMLSEYVKRHDGYSYLKILEQIEKKYLSKIDDFLKQGKIKKITLIIDNGVSISITAKQCRHWWKRIKSFSNIKYEKNN